VQTDRRGEFFEVVKQPGQATEFLGSAARDPLLLNRISFQNNGHPHSFIEKGDKNMTQQLYLISDVSRMLGVPPHRIAYLFTTRKVPEPPLRLGNRRVFGLADVRRVARALGRPTGGKEGR
jgi:hypothetical protein